MKPENVDALIDHARLMERMRLELLQGAQVAPAAEFTYSKEMLFRKLMDAYSVFDAYWFGEGISEDRVTEVLKDVAAEIGQRDDRGDTESADGPGAGDTGTGPAVPAAVAGLDAMRATAVEALQGWNGPVLPENDDAPR